MEEQQKPTDPASIRPRRTISNPGALKAVSAARQKPLPVEVKLTKEMVKEKAADTALNALGILRDAWADFRASSRFFKYKAGIIAGWLFLSVGSIFVACPSARGPSNELGAHLVTTEVEGRVAISVRNESDEPWKQILVVVNGEYRAAHPPVEPGGMLTVTPKLLATAEGKPAPADLRVMDLEIHTSEGKAHLVRGGRPR